ncbi:MAG: hypothetical protein JO122_12045 [Acetobacteraceae bacterium]|nr:hypothetical protein [Acetobacteraceae bacterium]
MSDTTERLMRATEALDRAAAEERIEPESTLGVWVASQREVLSALYEQERDRKAQIQQLIDNARATAEARAREVQALNRRMEIQQQDLETKTVRSLTDAVATKLKEVLVIREIRWNKKARVRSWLAAGALMLSLVIGGYTWRALQDSDAVSAYSRCYRETVKDPGTGKLYCPVETMLGG